MAVCPTNYLPFSNISKEHVDPKPIFTYKLIVSELKNNTLCRNPEA